MDIDRPDRDRRNPDRDRPDRDRPDRDRPDRDRPDRDRPDRDRPGRDRDRQTEVLDATYACLTRYGVRRTTMDDIATAMGVSRSAVYQYVRNKDDAFRRLAERLHTQALARARWEAAADAPPADRVHGILSAKLDLVLDLTGDSPHTVELLDEKARLFGDICHGFTADLRGLLMEVFAEAGPGAAVAGAAGAEVAAAAPSTAAPNAAADPSTPSARATDPGTAADICIALVLGLESTQQGARLLRPATDALLAGLLGGGDTDGAVRDRSAGA
ncbi:TetR/AcrR family transcriptional regulator [Streptomyces sp. H27-D2]|uniref:TetR/AcrR family transcriptional regulator n=1 Tax=Streptomyces sp. H27-D2 TaxID=3046304 RepID=UPI002DC04364|nr:helix-turn-helix domain-containing protein [Streptomyces sp. H27-D2]MEC4017551.1 helix-turn-helix domain-containing protein [Streptomyces sp. H27-D2]